MSPKRSAFIDIGTNTVLCVIADLRETGRFRVLDDLADIAGLGRGVDRTGLISAAGEQRCLNILTSYRKRCDSLGVEEIFAVGTSALRDAQNSAEVRTQLGATLGAEIRVISGEEEAAYSFLAVQRGLSLTGELLVIDIGGGSTEFIRGNESGVTKALSLNLGSVRLTERFLRSDPVGAEEFADLTSAIDSELAVLEKHWPDLAVATTWVGIAGTFTTMAAVEKELTRYSHSMVHGSHLTRVEVQRQVQLYRSKTLAERKTIPGLEPKRADVILAGACLIDRLMILFGARQLIVSDQGVRYGLLYERLDRR